MKYYYGSFVLFLTISIMLCPVSLSSALAEDHALLVGIERYKIAGANLMGIAIDIRNMQKVAGMMGFKKNQIKVLMDEDATLKGIENAFQQWLIQGVSAGDKVLFYYSGHGYHVTDQSGDEKDSYDEILIPYDTTESGENVLLDDRIGQLIAQIPTNKIFVLLDACYSGTATKSPSGNQSKFYPLQCTPPAPWDRGVVRTKSHIVEGVSSEKYVLLAAAQDNEPAQASSKGSYFTLGVVKAFNDAREKGSALTLQEVESVAREYIRSNLPPREIHRPSLLGNRELMTKNLIVTKVHSVGLWEEMEYLVQKANFKLNLSVNSKKQKVGDTLKIRCVVPENGYLNIMEVDRDDTAVTLLFPNKYHPQNHISKGQPIEIPSPGDTFVLRAKERGRSLLVAIFTNVDINAYRDGKGSSEALFRELSKNMINRSKYEVEQASRAGGVGAASVILHVK